MKKILVSIFCLFFISLGLIAQKSPDVFLKWAPASLAAGKVTIGGEYNFRKKHSVELFIGVPVKKTYRIKYDDQESDMVSKAFSILGGYRRYVGKKTSSGFYLEPFVKYLKHESSGILESDLSGEKARFNTITKYDAFGAGIQLGVQFIIAKRISLDLFFLGPEANSAKFTSSATDIASNIPWTSIKADEAAEEIKDAIKDIPIIGDKMEVRVDQNQKTVYTKYDGFLPGIRFGASLGIRL
jgi:Protein of unknown function (DUF3575)